MRIAHCVDEGSEMEIQLDLPLSAKDATMVMPVSTTGRVLRVRQQPLDTCDVAVQFTRPLAVDKT